MDQLPLHQIKNRKLEYHQTKNTIFQLQVSFVCWPNMNIKKIEIKTQQYDTKLIF